MQERLMQDAAGYQRIRGELEQRVAKRTEELRRLNRELRAISDCNQTLLRSSGEQTLPGEICDIICGNAGYRMAWVGYAEDDEAKTVRPVAWVGNEDGYLAAANISWADNERGRGTTACAIRSGKTACAQDFAADPQAALWREDALRHGYRSNIALPLKDEDGNTFGALSIYSEETGAFTPDEVSLLEELAGNLAFGIGTLRARSKLKQAEQERLEHLDFLENLDRINLAIQGAGSLEKMMSDVLGVLLEVLQCDRAFLIYPCDPEARSCRPLMERTVPAYPGAGAQKIDLEVAPETANCFRTLLGTAGPVTFGEGSDVPLPPDILQRHGFRSLIAMAIHPKTGKACMFGLHQCSGPRIWTRQEKQLFQEAGRRLTDGLTGFLTLESLKRSERHLKTAQHMARAGSWELDFDTRHTTVSEEALSILGLAPLEYNSSAKGRLRRLRDCIHPEDRECALQAFDDAMRHGSHDLEYRIVRPDGEVRHLRSAAAFVRDERGEPRGLSGTVQDITDAKLAEAHLKLLNRRLRAISSCNRSLIRAEDEQTLLERICRIVCEEAGYRMAWVGYAEDDAEKTVRPVAWSGAEEGYLASARISWADGERGHGPTGTAIRCGKTVCNQDFEMTFQSGSWREQALLHGYHSNIALPLKDEAGGTFGALTIYSGEPEAFTPTEIELLEELADDLAFGIGTLRGRAKLKQAERKQLAHMRFVESLDRVNRAIQGAPSLDRMMSDVLDVVLEVLQCDRAFLAYPCDPEAETWSSPMERTRPRYPGIMEPGLEMPMDGDVARTFRVLLDAPGAVQCRPGTDDALPTDFAGRFGIKSFMSVALHPRIGKPWQFGIHQCFYTRTWTLEEESLFQEIGRRLADGLTAMLVQRDLRESEAKYRRIVDTAREGIWGLGPDGLTTFVNARLTGMLGRGASEMIGRPVADFLFEEDVPDHLRVMERRRQGIGEDYERRFRHKDGHPVWAIVSGVPVFDDAHNFNGVFAMITDITERKSIEEALAQSEERLRMTLEAAQIGHWDWDIERNQWYASEIYYTMLGYSPGEGPWDRHRWLERVHPDDRDNACLQIQEVLKGKARQYCYEARMRCANGEYRWCFGLGVCMRLDAEGKAARIMGIRMDITQRKQIEAERYQAQQALVEHERQFRTVLENIPDFIVRYSPDLQRTYVNRAWEEGSGLSAGEIADVPASLLLAAAPRGSRDYAEKLNAAFETGTRQSIECTWDNTRGVTLHLDYRIVPEFGPDGKVASVLCVGRDVTELKKAGERLKRLNRELRAISDCSQTLMKAEDEQTLLNSICRIICEEAGYCMAWVGYAENDEAKTLRPVAWTGDADYIATLNLSWADTEHGRGPGGTAIRSGKTVYVGDFATDPRVALWRQNGLRRGYRACIALPLKDENGNTFGALVIYSTETGAFTPDEVNLLEELAGDLAFGIDVLRVRKERVHVEAEIRKLNQELEQRVAERTAALEQVNKELESFSYSVSHDLRAPLRAIEGFSHILREEYSSVLGEEGRHHTETIVRNAERMGQLISDILDFSRMSRREIAVAPVDMTELTREVYEEVRGGAPPERNIVLHLGDLPPARGDRAMLRQVLVNVLSNAVKYTGPCAEAVIEVNGTAAEAENTYWVKDNGVGFDMRYVDKLFDVFQRLHGDGQFEGTGIGLAIVKRIVTRHGGRVWAESELGKGTTLYFTLPASLAEPGG